MPKEIVEGMKRGGVDNPYALMNAAGIKHGDSTATAKTRLSSYQRGRKKKRVSAEAAGDKFAESGRA